VRSGILVLCLSAGCVAPESEEASSRQPAPEHAPLTGVALVGVQDLEAERVLSGAVAALGGELRTCFHGARVCLAAFDPGEPLPLDALRRVPGVRYADPDARILVHEPAPDLRPMFVDPPGTALCPDLWDLASLGVGDAWTLANDRGARAPVISIQDSGFVLTHHALQHAITGQYDYGNGDGVAEVSWNAGVPGHGTFIAGMLVDPDDAEGRVGVLPEGRLNLQKIADSGGALYFSYAIAAMADAAEGDLGIRVVNYSIAGSNTTTAFGEAVAALGEAGIVLVVAAGNCGVSGCFDANNDAYPLYPSSYTYDHLVSVAGHRRDGSLNPFSHYGLVSVDLAAPGVELCGPGLYADDDYFTSAGTSYATPLVAGTAGLLLGIWPRLDPTEVGRVLRASALDQAALTAVVRSGGILAADRALQTAVPRLDEPYDRVIDGYGTLRFDLSSVAAAGSGTLFLTADPGLELVRVTDPAWTLTPFAVGDTVPLPDVGPWVATVAGALVRGPLPEDDDLTLVVEVRGRVEDSVPVTARLIATSPGVASWLNAPYAGGALDVTGYRAWTLYADVSRALPEAELDLLISALVPGSPATFTARGANPGDVVRFARGNAEGHGPCPAFAVDRCFHLLAPTPMSTAVANAQGVAQLTVNLPASVPLGLEVGVQAVVTTGGGAWSEVAFAVTRP
jgi:hypothetical protein